MLVIIFYFLWGANVLCVLKKKRFEFLQITTFLFILLLYCGNSFNRDYWGYRGPYEVINMRQFEFGFRILGEFCGSLGMPYNLFVSLLIAPLYMGLMMFFRRYSRFIHLFYTLYFAVLFFYDVTQVRNFIVAALITFSVGCLMRKKTANAFLFILLATFFHKLALIYFVLLFVKPRVVIKHRKVLYFILFVLCACVYLNGLKIPFMAEILYAITKDQDKLIYGTQKMRIGFLIPIVLHLLNFGLVYFSEKCLNINEGAITKSTKTLLLWCKALAIIGCLTFPLIMTDLTYDRIIRNLSFIFLTFGCVTMESLAIRSGNKNMILPSYKKVEFLYFAYLAMYIILWGIGMPYRYGTFPSEKYLILHNNFFFK